MAEDAALFRVGRAPDPFQAWIPGESKNHNNRFDDPRGEFGVLYAAEERRAAFLETLARFRPDLIVLAALAALPDGDVGDDVPAEAGEIPDDWHLKRRLGVLRVLPGQRWLNLCDLRTREELRSSLASLFSRLGLTDFDTGDAISRDRRLTQAIAREAHERGYSGIVYPSRLEPSYRCWAIFEGARIEIEDIAIIARDDGDLLNVARIFGLRLAL